MSEFQTQIELSRPILHSRMFNPNAHGLEATFRLTKFADLKGRGPKVSQDILSKLLTAFQEQCSNNSIPSYVHLPVSPIGIGYDCSITPLRNGGMYTHFFKEIFRFYK